MPPLKKFGVGRRKFYGNRFTKKKEEVTGTCAPSTSDRLCEASASKKKLTHIQTATDQDSFSVNIDEFSYASGSVIVELNVLSKLFKKSVRCISCSSEGCIEIVEDILSRKGLSSKLCVMCSVCGAKNTDYSSSINKDRMYNNNIRLAYAMRCVGKGQNACETFCAVMNLPPPPRLNRYHDILENSLTEVATTTMKRAVEESVKTCESTDIAVAFDGTWHKRGHTSLNGVVTATSLENGKIIDVDCLTKHCHGCKTSKNNHTCNINFEGYSGGMEAKGVLNIFNRSQELYNVRYVQYLGDGDSKAFLKVIEAKPYGNSVNVEKLECLGHVQKRMGTRLRKLRKDLKGKKLSDNKPLSGRGRLTDSEIDLLQNYFGLAIRRNQTDLHAMRRAVWATFFHKASTDDKPEHGLCPKGSDSWCGYWRAKESGQSYSHKHSLPQAVLDEIKPIYRSLSSPELLQKCLHGRTQNPNESFHRCIWDRVPKTTFVGLQTLKLGVMDAVICFNEGSVSRMKVLEHLGIVPGDNMSRGLLAMDHRRLSLAEKVIKECSKEGRTRKRNAKRQQDDAELSTQDEYSAGMY